MRMKYDACPQSDFGSQDCMGMKGHNALKW